MNKYHKIENVFNRDQETGKLLYGNLRREEFAYLLYEEWEATEKVDGTNIRLQYNQGDMVVKGKTDHANIPGFLSSYLDNVVKRITGNMQETFGDSATVCLYGEGYGRKIQKNGHLYNSDGVGFVLFDVRAGDVWLRRDDVNEIADLLGLECAPVIATETLSVLIEKVRGGIQSQWGNFVAEGVVARPRIELNDRLGRRIITKIKTIDFS